MNEPGDACGETALDVPFCGLPCLPLRLELEGDVVRALGGGCPVCRAAVEAPSVTGPALVDGKPATLEVAVAHASELLRAARRPLVHGLAHSTTGTARLAAAVAARLRGAIDIEGSARFQPEIDVVQSSGGCTATFGAIRSSADVVLLWRTDPRATHPRLLGDGDGTPARRFIVVTERSAPREASKEDLIVPLPPGDDLEAALVLRSLVSGRAPRRGSLSSERTAALVAAGEALRAARYAAIVCDVGGVLAGGGATTARSLTAALQALAASLQETTRSAVVSLGAGGNVAGAMAALLSSCGLPRAVSFLDGTPRSCAGRADGAVSLATIAADAFLFVGPQGGSAEATPRVRRADGAPAPCVVVGPRRPAGLDEAEVMIPTAVPALSESGIWLRADGVPLRLAAPVASKLPREGEVLRRLLSRLEAAA
jgi:formylmethanofuran dehydrogenase subunit B